MDLPPPNPDDWGKKVHLSLGLGSSKDEKEKAGQHGGKAGRVFQEILERLDVLMDTHGLYKPLWDLYIAYDDAGGACVAMNALETFFNQFHSSALKDTAGMGEAFTPTQVEEIEALYVQLGVICTNMEAAFALVSKGAAVSTKDMAGHALQVLNGLASGWNQKEWQAAQKTCAKFISKGIVIGPAAAINDISELLRKYVLLWDKLGTDGLKGANMEIIKAMEEIRLTIVNIVNRSSLFMMVCCGPGTVFYKNLAALASQECGSRDVQNILGWWNANAKRE